MKYNFLFIVLFTYTFLSSSKLVADESVKDNILFLQSKIDSSDIFKIKLSWNYDSLSYSSELYKKTNLDDDFELIGEFSPDTTVYVDKDVQNYAAYEYMIKNNRQINDTTIIDTYSYIYTGANVSIDDNKGKILLLVDKTIYSEIYNELIMFKKDLIGDGYTVDISLVPRSEEFDAKKVIQVKEIIREKYSKYGNELGTLILVGRVPVPYSGAYSIDGHDEENFGAWPSDVFYSDLDGQWIDKEVSENTCDWVWHHNIPYDGKYDNSYIPGNSLFEMGRIDFYDMPEFNQTEIELLKRYFNKNHVYRKAEKKYKSNAIIDDKWGNFYGPMANSVWSNYNSLLDTENIEEKGLIENLGENEYLFAYGGASGARTSLHKTAYTELYAKEQRKAIFVEFFGSRLVDWDTKNNLLRAAIASEPSILVSYFGVRPGYKLQYMGLGKTIGFSGKNAQNKTYEQYPDYVGYGNKMTHINLMGDPTLKMYVVEPPGKIEVMWDLEEKNSKISWIKSDDDNIVGYNIYKSKSLDDKFIKLNDDKIESLKYTDNDVFGGDLEIDSNVIYMVRAIKWTEAKNGSFYNYSNGSFYYPKDYKSVDENTDRNIKNIYLDRNNSALKFDRIIDKLYLYDYKLRLLNKFKKTQKIDFNSLSLGSGIYFLRYIKDNNNIAIKILYY